jgi:YD repeat-containing protein
LPPDRALATFTTGSIAPAPLASEPASALTAPPAPLASAEIGPSVGGTITAATARSTLTLTFPAGTVTDTVRITLVPLADGSQLPANALGMGLAYDLAAATSPGGQPLTQFALPFTVSLSYTPSALGGAAEQRLLLATSSDDGVTWRSLPTTIDATAHTATTQLSHFSLLALVAQADLAGPMPIVLAPASPPISSTLPLTPTASIVVYSNTVTFDYSAGTTVLLSSTGDGNGELLADDVVRITVGNDAGTPTYEHDYWDNVQQAHLPTGPVDLTSFFQTGTNTVTLELLDARAPVSWTQGYLLVQPRNPYARVIGAEGPTLLGAGSVDLASGNYVRAETDLAAPAPGLDVSFTRTYNSYDPTGGPFGFGWSSPYDSRATRYVDGSVEITLPSGRRALFMPDGSGGFTPEPGVLDTLAAASSGYILTQKTTLVAFHFDGSGLLTRISEPHGNAVVIAYAGHVPASLTDPAGRVYTFTTDVAGRITAITDPSGVTLRYGYDAVGNLVSYADARGGTWHLRRGPSSAHRQRSRHRAPRRQHL